jgi:outer membrane protein OmpA-like peptidoglycan-associated protein
MRRQALVLGITVLTFLTTAIVSSGCSTRKFTRNELKALETNLSVRLDADGRDIARLDSNAKELADRIGSVDRKTNDNAAEIVRVKTDLTTELTRVDGKAADANTAARNAQSGADRANAALTFLEDAFRNRSNYDLVAEKQILFPFNSSRLGEDFEVPLTEVANQLKQNPEMFVVLEGRTDNVGNADYNIQLGRRRNETVHRFLIVREGVPMYNVYQTSFGKDQPIAKNDSKEGREQNRSVVLRLYKPRNAVISAR